MQRRQIVQLVRRRVNFDHYQPDTDEHEETAIEV